MTTPARNIAQVNDFGDAKYFTAICACNDPDHSQYLCVEAEMDDPLIITCSIYQQLEWADYDLHNSKFPMRLWHRLKRAMAYLFTGRVQVEGHHLFDNENAIRDYANALIGAADELAKQRDLSAVRKGAGNSVD
jgi:hypothetical protein